jgi:hypothetical protein
MAGQLPSSDSDVELPSNLDHDESDVNCDIMSTSDVQLPSESDADIVGGDNSSLGLPSPAGELHNVSDGSDMESLPSLPSDASEDEPGAELDGPVSVPSPHDVQQIMGAFIPGASHKIAEYYSPPRVLPVARQQGLHGTLALDILTGWDLTVPWIKELSLLILTRLHILMIILSPPCTAFSPLQRMWNFPKLSAIRVSEIWNTGMIHLDHAMQLAWKQLNEGRFFAFEHPASASSFAQACMCDLLVHPHVEAVVFDQCMLGLVTKVTRTPTRKRTRIVTNNKHLVEMLRPVRCDRSHVHCKIQGSEGGERRSVWAQRYPPGLVQILVDASAALG